MAKNGKKKKHLLHWFSSPETKIQMQLFEQEGKNGKNGKKQKGRVTKKHSFTDWGFQGVDLPSPGFQATPRFQQTSGVGSTAATVSRENILLQSIFHSSGGGRYDDSLRFGEEKGKKNHKIEGGRKILNSLILVGSSTSLAS